MVFFQILDRVFIEASTGVTKTVAIGVVIRDTTRITISVTVRATYHKDESLVLPIEGSEEIIRTPSPILCFAKIFTENTELAEPPSTQNPNSQTPETP